MIKEHNQIVVALMGLGDLLVTAAAWGVCYWLRFHSGWFHFQEDSPPPLSYIADIVVISLLLVLIIFRRFDMYLPRRIQPLRTELFEIIRACAATWLTMVVISYFLYSSPISRKLVFMLLFVWPAMMVAYRGSTRLMLRFFRRRGRNVRHAAIIGAGRLGQTLLHNLRRQRWTGYEIQYFVENHRFDEKLLGIPIRGPIDRIDQLVGEYPVDVVFVALPHSRSEAIATTLDKLAEHVVDINVVPDLLSYQFLNHRVQTLGELPIVNLTHSRQSGWNAVAKRTLDIVLSLAALVVLSPLMLTIGLLVKFTSTGPVFFRQRRASLGGEEFTLLKFRSMAHGATSDEWGTARNDPRVTPVGRVLRKLSLDELPQLLNVLLGDMSLVGPRPEISGFVDKFRRQIPRYALRHHVKAGLTGWAQVHGLRGRTSLQKRIQYDLDYINRWSITLDLWILVMTLFRGIINPQD